MNSSKQMWAVILNTVIVFMFMVFFMMFFLMKFLMKFSIYLVFSNSSYINLKFGFIFESVNLMFLLVVLIVSLSVYLFSVNYMFADQKNMYFHMLLSVFVVSMLILILSSSLEVLIIGWDGLGISSYLLVIYFNSSVSLSAGYLTVLVNRLGDSFFLLMFIFLYNYYFNNFIILNASMKLNYFMIFLLISGSFTKSAQLPFSAWLPSAMAAPTPVSSLVHSSTLVTAGIFVLLRFQDSWYFSKTSFSQIIFFVGCLTMLMASLAGFVEKDMKKIVALSTLSQMGLMVSSLGLGSFFLTYFHLFTHAFFKALLFIASGTMIHCLQGYQDLRKHGSMETIFPLSFMLILSANFSLMGFPFLAGFYSKDLIIEKAWSSSFNCVFIIFMFLSIMFTVIYVVRFMNQVIIGNFHSSLFNSSEKCYFYLLSSLALLALSCVSGKYLSETLLYDCESLGLAQEMKIFLLLTMGLILVFKLNFKPNSVFIIWGMCKLFSLKEIKQNFLKYLIFSYFYNFVILSEKKFFSESVMWSFFPVNINKFSYMKNFNQSTSFLIMFILIYWSMWV